MIRNEVCVGDIRMFRRPFDRTVMYVIVGFDGIDAEVFVFDPIQRRKLAKKWPSCSCYYDELLSPGPEP